MTCLRLDDRRLDFWFVRSDAAADRRLLDEYRELLSPEELARADRFRIDRVREEFFLTRALARTVLGQYVGRDPAALAFAFNKHGKPALAAPAAGVEFNLSNTRGLVVCGVIGGRAIGVDVEVMDRTPNYIELARRFFAACEADVLGRLPVEEQRSAFLRFWTLKEAFIKARGLGLSLPLDDFWFTVEGDRPAEIAFRAGSPLEPAGWQFGQFRFGAEHHAAFAVPLARTEPLVIHVHECVPLRWQSAAQVLPPSVTRSWAIGGE